jgi:Cd2+/Zn2+-exporting ATPase
MTNATSLFMHQPSNDKKHEGGVACCSHHQDAQSERSIVLYLVGATLLIAAFLVRQIGGTSELVSQIPALDRGRASWASLSLSRLWRGAQVTMPAVDRSTLAALAILAAMATGQYASAGWLAFILLFADSLSAVGLGRAAGDRGTRELTPDVARLVTPKGRSAKFAGEVKVGIGGARACPARICPSTARCVTGRSTINQASLTGEAVPVEVQSGDPVYAGTTNLTGAIDLAVTQVGEDTTIGKVTQLIREAERAARRGRCSSSRCRGSSCRWCSAWRRWCGSS